MARKSKKNSKKYNIEKGVKKSPLLILIVVIVALGFCGGFFAFNQLTQNDTFEIVGESSIVLNVGEEYVEQGAKLISFGKDKTVEIKIEKDVDTSQPGLYYVKYTTSDFRFKSVVRYRYVEVVASEVTQ